MGSGPAWVASDTARPPGAAGAPPFALQAMRKRQYFTVDVLPHLAAAEGSASPPEEQLQQPATGAPIEPAVGAAGDCGCSARIQRARHSSSPPPLDDDMPRRRSAATSPAVRNSPRPTPTPEAASGARPLHPPRQTSDTRSRSIDAAASVSLATRSSPLATRPSPRLSACVRPLEPQLLEPLSILDLDLDSRSAA